MYLSPISCLFRNVDCQQSTNLRITHDLQWLRELCSTYLLLLHCAVASVWFISIPILIQVTIILLHRSMNGCDGADHPSYGVFYADKLKGQSAHEGTYPYLDTSPKLTCPAGLKVYNSGAYVTKALPDYNCDENKLKALVATYGAAVASIYASDVSLGNYGNVVFNKCTNTSTNHAVLVVGYGTDPTSKLDYWLIRNSWGTNWGANGFFKLQRGNGQCGIGKKCYASDCAKTTGPISDPPIIPPPPPIPASQECDVTALFGVLNGGVYELTYGSKLLQFLCLPRIFKNGPTPASYVYIHSFQTQTVGFNGI